MSHLSSHIEDYLATRRALGFKLAKEGRLLRDFAAFAEAAGAGTVACKVSARQASAITCAIACAAVWVMLR